MLEEFEDPLGRVIDLKHKPSKQFIQTQKNIVAQIVDVFKNNGLPQTESEVADLVGKFLDREVNEDPISSKPIMINASSQAKNRLLIDLTD